MEKVLNFTAHIAVLSTLLCPRHEDYFISLGQNIFPKFVNSKKLSCLMFVCSSAETPVSWASSLATEINLGTKTKYEINIQRNANMILKSETYIGDLGIRSVW